MAKSKQATGIMKYILLCPVNNRNLQLNQLPKIGLKAWTTMQKCKYTIKYNIIPWVGIEDLSELARTVDSTLYKGPNKNGQLTPTIFVW